MFGRSIWPLGFFVLRRQVLCLQVIEKLPELVEVDIRLEPKRVGYRLEHRTALPRAFVLHGTYPLRVVISCQATKAFEAHASPKTP